MSEHEEDADKLARFLSSSSGVSAAAVEVGLSFILGPVGGVAGAAGIAAAQAAMRMVGSDFVDRQLSELQQRRVRQLLLLAGERIDQKLAHGHEVRSDRFFVREFGSRGMADELLEGVLLAAQLEYEERKLPYLASLYAFLVFEPDVGRMQANMLIRIAQELSFTQYRLLAIFGQPERTKNLHGWYEEDGDLSPQSRAVLVEGLALAQRNLLAVGLYDEDYGIPEDLGSFNPSRTSLTDIGESLYRAMELWRIPDEDLEEVDSALS